MLRPLLSLADRVIAVEPALERALAAETLAGFCRQEGAETVAGGSVGEGLELAVTMARGDDLVLVCGSLFTVGEARSILTGSEFMPIRG
jgi:dihydrofolate synthase/folylpolyglutamate synthase